MPSVVWHIIARAVVDHTHARFDNFDFNLFWMSLASFADWMDQFWQFFVTFHFI